MKLKDYSFPVSFSLEEALNLIKEFAEPKGWKNIELAEAFMSFTPYFIFSYDAFIESRPEPEGEGEDEGLGSISAEKIVSETMNGKDALNALTSELEEGIAASIDEGIELTKEVEVPKGIEVEEKSTLMTEDEARKIAQIKVAQKLGVGKDNVIIHQLRKVLFPIVFVSVSIEGEEQQEFLFSGVDGSMLSEVELPERGQTASEIFKDTLSDLKRPSSWLKYSAGIVSGLAGGLKKGLGATTAPHRRWFVWALLIIILILAFFWAYGWVMHWP
ncbi:MAG: hypothetical protein AB1467_04340 [Candidatus Diapherotrites archaeon]